MHPLITFLLENAAYAGFALTWAAHFCTARSYKRTARMIRQQETETQTSDSRPKEAISVVIATHNQADALRRNLPRILEQEYERFEVIVVNDASTDDTEDVLKTLELKYANLHHTFTPSGARHISHKRLSLTIGIKAAQYEWLLLTEPDSRPCSPHWLSTMAGHFHDGVQIVLGYANYMPDKRLLSRKAIFFNLFHQMQYLPWATRHKAYRCNPANIAYRKSLFMAHKGFADDINLIGGVTELLVNRHSRIGNTAVSLHPDSKVECENMTSGKQWRLKRTFYMETRRHFKKTWRYRLTFNLKQAVIPLFYCATALSLGWSVWWQQWAATAIISLLFVLLCVCKTVWFNRSARALGERPYRLSFLWYEMRLLGWHACSWMDYRTAPRTRFYRKAF